MKRFKDLTIRGQKIRIVKDAIAQIIASRFDPTTGHYLCVYTGENFTSLDMKRALEASDTKCEGCAKAGLFMACVLNVNKVKLNEAYSTERFEKMKLKKCFSALELDMIEAAFEGEVIADTENKLEVEVEEWGTISKEETKLAKICINFGDRYNNDKNRLLAIFENILKYGEFRPDGKTKISDYRTKSVLKGEKVS